MPFWMAASVIPADFASTGCGNQSEKYQYRHKQIIAAIITLVVLIIAAAFRVDCRCAHTSKQAVIVSVGVNKTISGREICRHMPEVTIARLFRQLKFSRQLANDRIYNSINNADSGDSSPAKFQYTKLLELAQSIAGHGHNWWRRA